MTDDAAPIVVPDRSWVWKASLALWLVAGTCGCFGTVVTGGVGGTIVLPLTLIFAASIQLPLLVVGLLGGSAPPPKALTAFPWLSPVPVSLGAPPLEGECDGLRVRFSWHRSRGSGPTLLELTVFGPVAFARYSGRKGTVSSVFIGGHMARAELGDAAVYAQLPHATELDAWLAREGVADALRLLFGRDPTHRTVRMEPGRGATLLVRGALAENTGDETQALARALVRLLDPA